MPDLAIKYTAAATADDGRDGHVATDDGTLDVIVSPPAGMSYKVKSMRSAKPERDGETGTNPEQLFAAGYCASFHGALGAVAHVANLDVTDSRVTAKVALGKNEKGGLGIEIEMCVSVPNLDEPTVRKLAKYAHEIDPYSIAMRGNIPVRLTVV